MKMPKFMFAYHGGKAPESPEEGAEVMARWQAWFGTMGDAVVDGGNPAGPSKTVSKDGVANDGGSNPLGGYSLVQAENIEAAVEMAKGCPIMDHGTVEVAEAMEM
jgi:hypothetical protein